MNLMRFDKSIKLRWIAGNWSKFHEVYLGKINPPGYVSTLTANTYNPGDSETNTTYYCRVDEVNMLGRTEDEL